MALGLSPASAASPSWVRPACSRSARSRVPNEGSCSASPCTPTPLDPPLRRGHGNSAGPCADREVHDKRMSGVGGSRGLRFPHWKHRRATSQRESRTQRKDTAGTSLDGVQIGTLDASDMAEAVDVIKRGMLDNPTHVAALGKDPDVRRRRVHRIFSKVLPITGNPLIAARGTDGTILGLLGMAAPGTCQLAVP